MNRDLKNIQKDYSRGNLIFDQVDKNPFVVFNKWLDDAIMDEPQDASAMVLSTVSEANKPSSRVVLLKEFSSDGFVFYTNYKSRKGIELSQNPFAAINFFWRDKERQVRIEGRIEKLSDEKSDAYFNQRPMDSKLGAIVSPQSEVLANQNYLLEKVAELKHSGQELKRPEYWGGYILIPDLIEFWQGRPNRLNDRICFGKTSGSDWKKTLLAP